MGILCYIFYYPWSLGNEFSLLHCGGARAALTVGLEENTLAPRLFPEKSATFRRQSASAGAPAAAASGQHDPMYFSGMIIY